MSGHELKENLFFFYVSWSIAVCGTYIQPDSLQDGPAEAAECNGE